MMERVVRGRRTILSNTHKRVVVVVVVNWLSFVYAKRIISPTTDLGLNFSTCHSMLIFARGLLNAICFKSRTERQSRFNYARKYRIKQKLFVYQQLTWFHVFMLSTNAMLFHSLTFIRRVRKVVRVYNC